MPPFLRGSSGTYLEVSTHVAFPFSSRTGKDELHAGHRSIRLATQNSLSSQSHAYSGQWPVNNSQFQVASRQHEWSFQNGKARLVPSGPHFRGHTQHTSLCFLASPKRHRLLSGYFPESTPRSRVFCIKQTASTSEHPS